MFNKNETVRKKKKNPVKSIVNVKECFKRLVYICLLIMYLHTHMQDGCSPYPAVVQSITCVHPHQSTLVQFHCTVNSRGSIAN